MVGAVAMASISMLTAGSLMKDVTSLSKVSDIDMNTKTQQTADAESGKCPKGEGIGCFVAGTKVKTEDGEKNIEDVETGDYVLAENPETGEQEYKEVVRTYIHEKTAIVHVFVGEEEIETTVEHPFYVEGVGFVSAGELKAGDIIRTSEGKNLPIDKIEIEELEEPVLVYNFEVEDFHTYYVSDLGVLVHNTCGDTTVGESGKGANKVYFGQKAVSPNFSPQGTFKGASIQSVSDRLIKGELSPDDLPIEYIVRNGKKITMNNRSLTALSKAKMKPTKLINITGNAIEEAKLTQRLSEMGGKPSESIFIRKIKEVVYLPD